MHCIFFIHLSVSGHLGCFCVLITVNSGAMNIRVRVWKMSYIYMMEDCSAIKKNELMPFAATWMQLEIIILSEISQSEKHKYI